MSKNITRRRFLVLGGGAGLSAFLGGAYVVSACPLSDSGVCVGPCAAYIDQVGDGLCDRAYADQAQAQSVAQSSGSDDSQAAGSSLTRCPLGLVNDPYPGECRRYVDLDGDGICDLSIPQSVGRASLPDSDAGQASVPDTGQSSLPDTAANPTFTVACPLGLVNDPYPGECRRYVDRDGDGICDLSIPQPVGRASLPDTDAGQASVPDTGQSSLPDTAANPTFTVACPFGLVNDPFPGECRRYTDRDGDGICDLSVPGSGLNAPGDTREGEEDGQRRRRGWGTGRR